MEQYLYHLIDTDTWLSFDKRTDLKPASLESEGFVHCSFAYQVSGTLKKHFKDDDRLTLLRILKSDLKGELKVENNYGGIRLFPHLYAPIPATAIIDAADIPNPREFRFPSNWRDPGEFKIRAISPDDNAAVSEIIKSVMTEYGAVGSDFSIEDPEVTDMHRSYQGDRSKYYVVETNSEILGCGGIGPLLGADSDVAEIKKMYFVPELRGFGVAPALMECCLNDARAFDFKSVYLETLHTMLEAQKFYRSVGFEQIKEPVGKTGHCGCDMFFRKFL